MNNILMKTVTPYYIWDTCFTGESLRAECGEAGFQACGIFSDVV